MTSSVFNHQAHQGSPILTEVDALWEQVRIQFSEAYRLEQMGDSESSITWIQQHVTPAVQSWSGKSTEPSDKKKQMLRLLFDQVRQNIRAQALPRSSAPATNPLADAPVQRPRETTNTTRPPNGRRSVNNPYTSNYQRIHQLRTHAKKVPLGDISEMIDEVKDKEYGAATASFE